MRKLFLIILILVLTVTIIRGDATWVAGNEFTNPTVNTILVDTGGIYEFDHSFQIVCAADVNANIAIEHRNVANDTTLKSQLVRFGGPGTVGVAFNVFFYNTNERVRVRLHSAISLGTIQCSIFHS